MNKNILSTLVISDVLSANTFFTCAGVGRKKKSREHWAIVLKFEGETVYMNNGKKIVSNACNMVILPKGCNYEWVCTDEGIYSIVEFDTDFTCNEIFTFKISDNSKIQKKFRELAYIRSAQKPNFQMESIKSTYEILLLLLNSSSVYSPSPKVKKIQPALDYIANYYYKEINNDYLSSLAGISTVYFRKLFKESFGISPISYIHKMRITKAQEMLCSDYGKISDIARNVGYNDIYHFSKMFKLHAGVSPSAYVKMQTQKIERDET